LANHYANILEELPKIIKNLYCNIIMKKVPITTIKLQATKLLKELREEKEPVLITEHGIPSAYLVNVDHFEQIQRKLKLLEGIARGETAILEGRVVSHAEAKKRVSAEETVRQARMLRKKAKGSLSSEEIQDAINQGRP